MKNIFLSIIYLIIFSFSSATLIFADDKGPSTPLSGPSVKTSPDSSGNAKKSLSSNAFVLETNQESSSESLDRISGTIDRGFSSPENSYKTLESPGAGPFAKEKAELKKQADAAY